MQLHLKERFAEYSGPWELFWEGFKFLLQSFKPGTPPHERGKDPAFAKLFKSIGHHFVTAEATTAVPSLVGSCYGITLELGPATGNQLPRFTPSLIKHIYGVEPNTSFMPMLSSKISETELNKKYTPVNCGIEDIEVLKGYGIEEGSMDCVLSVQVLCSVKDPAVAVGAMYRLLKPGGELIFWEHHVNQDLISRFVQRIWDFAWSMAIGGCHIDRPIKDILLQAGNWEVIELHTNEKAWLLFPRTWGKLRKAKTL
ncbi:S-adenosyl-L-methionine-dependent methyltransferase [Bisporella sp. PMI_857]|nr:S-adenosyl-L-methionine-dependent methyltransferase [Bisporella sp. PMI_857]